ncbi:hypothetical protein LSTR_LSTR001621 [Laodelphax striatellus]|uniref:Uncharacterized protein n=1 Tax=Laodelphax striatellus TaxID=195883 RepID=A0A482XCU9_LAOST|nr:hypothetical protein LSTR_LSTR001621 [Laodelphax striatellus]
MHKTYENKLPTSDKLAQLQNALKLEERTAKQSRLEAIRTKKGNVKYIRKLEQDIIGNREKLKVFIHGDKEGRRDAFKQNKFYQLAYQNVPSKDAVEHIKQRIFTTRKECDKLGYERSKLEKILSNLKFQLQELKKPEKFISATHDEQEILNKIQSMLKKQNTARVVNDSYEQLLNMLEKESLRFDKTLKSMETDRVTQAKCIVRATETGQEASHKLADLHDSYKLEERKLRRFMKRMDLATRNLKLELEAITNSCREFGQADSLILYDDEEEYNKDSIVPDNLKEELIELEQHLLRLKDITEVLTIDDIYPRMKLQNESRTALLEVIEQQDSLGDKLLEQHKELFALLEQLEQTIVPSTESFKIEQEKLIEQTNQMIEDKKHAEKDREYIGAYVSDIRMGLITLNRKLDRVDRLSRYETELNKLESPCVSETNETLLSSTTDPLSILENVNTKLLMLVNRYKLIDVPLTNAQYLKGKKKLEQQVIQTNATEVVEDVYEHAMSEILKELVSIEDPSVPSRADIKKQSARIVRLLGSEE